ncbi:MAG TPA: hypothetical protein VIL63_09385 [Terriglobales bacterium]
MTDLILMPTPAADARVVERKWKRRFAYGGFLTAGLFAMAGWIWFLAWGVLRLANII